MSTLGDAALRLLVWRAMAVALLPLMPSNMAHNLLSTGWYANGYPVTVAGA